MTIPSEVGAERGRRLANQRVFRRYYIDCWCEAGCNICAYTGLITKGHAKHVTDVGQDDGERTPGS